MSPEHLLMWGNGVWHSVLPAQSSVCHRWEMWWSFGMRKMFSPTRPVQAEAWDGCFLWGWGCIPMASNVRLSQLLLWASPDVAMCKPVFPGCAVKLSVIY